MGWCGGTEIFDTVVEALDQTNIDYSDEAYVIEQLIEVLEDKDWDCQCESVYYQDDEMVRSIFKKLHPEWFEEEIE